MKNLNRILFNPFIKIAGLRSLLLGLAIMLITSVLAYFANTRFNGVIDVHAGKSANYSYYLIDGLNAWLSMVVIFYPICLFVTKMKVRFIDVAGTFLLARFPLIFDTLLVFCLKNSVVNGVLTSLVQKANIDIAIQVTDWILFILLAILTLLCSVWFIALNYNAFKVNSNLKGAKLVWIFVGGVLLAEILSIIIFSQINYTSPIANLSNINS